MSNQQMTTTQSHASVVEQVAIQGDLSKLSPADRVIYYGQVCESLGLNPLTQPLEYIQLNGKLRLYARKDCTDQLRRIHRVSIAEPRINYDEKEWIIVTVVASTPDGRTDSDVGVVSRKDMQANFGNALMKAVTKAKRRVTLSVCGLGMLDETEVETIPGAATVTVEAAHPAIAPAPQSLAKPAPQQPAPAQPINGHAQPTPAPVVPTRAEKASKYLDSEDAKLSKAGLSNPGELRQHVVEAGLHKGYPPELLSWSDAQLDWAAGAIKAFVEERSKPKEKPAPDWSNPPTTGTELLRRLHETEQLWIATGQNIKAGDLLEDVQARAKSKQWKKPMSEWTQDQISIACGWVRDVADAIKEAATSAA